MGTPHATHTAVIARLDRAIQYAAAVVSLTNAGEYCMPTCADMTADTPRGHQ